MLRSLLCAVFLAVLFTGTARADGAPAQLVTSWTELTWAFPSKKEARAFEASGTARRAPLANLKVGRDGEIYVTVPRWMDKNVPATLNKVVNVGGRSVLEPFPSWASNRLDEPRALRNVLGLHIDGDGLLWALDMGGGIPGVDKVPDLGQKLVAFDIQTRRLAKWFPIGDHLADRNKSFLNDLAYDEANGFVYISDSGVKSAPDNQTAIIVINVRNGQGRRVLANHPSTKNDRAFVLAAAGDEVFPGNPMQTGINGIAASADGSWVYWSVTTGDRFHRVPAALLRDFRTPDAEIAQAVEDLGSLGSGADGIAIDRAGKVYITDLANSRIVRFDPDTKIFSPFAKENDWVWPDTLAWGADGWLYLSVGHLHRAFAGKLDYAAGTPNYQIWRIQTGAVPGTFPVR